MKALVGVEQAMLAAPQEMLTADAFYRELGENYFTARKPAAIKTNAIRQLEALGFAVTLEPLAA